MKLSKFFSFMAAAMMVMTMASCSNKDDANDEPVLPPTPPTQLDVDGIVALTEGIGDWDEAFVTPHGFFCYSDDAKKLTDAVSRSESGSKTHVIAHSDASSNPVVTIIFNDLFLPIQISGNGWSLYFCYLNMETVEVVLGRGDKMELIGTATFEKDEIANMLYTSSYGTRLQNYLSFIVELLERQDGDLPAEIAALLAQYKELLGLDSKEDFDLSDIAIYPGEDGTYKFAFKSKNDAVEVVTRMTWSIGLWTGNASFKVGGSSCTLGGAIFCNSPLYNEYGRYGILVDTNADNLIVGKADYEVLAHQNEGEPSFEVDFRGFKPNTTYYYRAFYAFNSTDHGDLTFRFGNPNAQECYDDVIKSFTTGDNSLTVDVVMCIDVTGSMYDIISTVKSHALSFYDLFKSRCDERGIILTGLNSQVIAFADINVDGDRALNMSPVYSMPAQQDEFKNYVDALYANGGGDAPESALEALEMAFDKTDWGVDDGYHRQVVILWTDAPYLVGADYTSLTAEMVMNKWNKMPSGRRMIIFGPDGDDYYNSGYWQHMSTWTNTVVNYNYAASFTDFGLSLDMIIDELTSRAKSESMRTVARHGKYFNNRPAN